jgi:hypothetical protein
VITKAGGEPRKGLVIAHREWVKGMFKEKIYGNTKTRLS